MHGNTVSTTAGEELVFSGSLCGKNANTPQRITKPIMKCAMEPADITIVRFHTG